MVYEWYMQGVGGISAVWGLGACYARYDESENATEKGEDSVEVYVYQAELLCVDCAGKVMQALRDRGLEPDEDSDRWPIGPYPDGGGEADYPAHCRVCGLFLRNPLTPEGEQYVLERAQRGGVPKDWLVGGGVEPWCCFSLQYQRG